MKISLLISDISRSGGTERSVVTLANMLSKKYELVEILSVVKTKKEKSYYDIEPNVSVKFLNHDDLEIGLFGKIKWSFSTIMLLRNYFKNNVRDFVISTGHNYNWFLPFVKTDKQIKIIACEHIVYESIPYISRAFMKFTYNFLDAIVVLSEKAKNSFKKYSNVIVIPNSLPFLTKDISSLDNKKILIVGRLSKEKGLERLIPIATDVSKKFHDWEIVVLGDGPEKHKLEELMIESNISDFIVMKGAVADVQSFYLKSSIYIMTSHYEAFPMVLLEAQSFGLPVVAYDCPEGPSQIVKNGENGYLIQNGDNTDFVNKLFLLIESENLRKEFGKKAKLNSEKFTQDVIIEKWSSLFKTLK